MPRRFFCLLILPFLLCVTAGARAQSGYWINVPYVAQQKDGCGAAVISMLMQYWQRQQGRAMSAAAEPKTILHALYSPRAHGIYAPAMERYFRQHGFRAFAFAGRWQDFARELEKGRPLIVALKPDGSTSLHYVVVAGVDPERQVVMLNDPERRKLFEESRAQFERDWKFTHNWTLLVVPQMGSTSEPESAQKP